VRIKTRKNVAKYKRRKDPKRKRRVLIAFAFFCFLSAVIYLVLFSGALDIRYINYYGGTGLQLDRLKTVEADVIGRNLFTPRLKRLREELLSLPMVKDVVFRRKPLHDIECYIIERKPVALVMGREPFAVDEDGVVLESRLNLHDVDLPILTGIGEEELEKEKGKQMIRKAMTVLKLYKESGIEGELEVSEIHVQGEDVILVVGRQGTVVRFGRDQYLEAARKLKAIYRILGGGRDFPSMIDLRFDGQVVVR